MPSEYEKALADLLDGQSEHNQGVLDVLRMTHAELSRHDVLIAGAYDQLNALSHRIEAVTRLVASRTEHLT